MPNQTAGSLIIVPDGTDELKLEHLVRHYRIFKAKSPVDTITKGVIVLKAAGLAPRRSRSSAKGSDSSEAAQASENIGRSERRPGALAIAGSVAR